jgi:Protein of unknown function (DUF3037)
MHAPSVFEYAAIRVVPRVERGEFVNAGVVLFCRTRRFLAARVRLSRARLLALAPDIDAEAVEELLGYIPLVCQGGAGAGPIGELPAHERFRWIIAPRSTVVQPAPVHSGVCADPEAELVRLMAALVPEM